MSKAEKSQEAESSNRQAVEVLKALSHFEYPEEVSRVGEWLQRTKPLQFLVKSYCGRDRTGRVTLECVNVVFDLMATHGEAVSPAIWDVLEVVEEDEIKFLTETFLKDSKPRLKNSLNALVSGICQCGQRMPRLQAWCFAFVQALEDRQKYSVLLSLPQGLLLRLLQAIALPHAAHLAYALLERLLYPMTYPHLFNILVDHLPALLPALPDDDTRHHLCALAATLLDRFSPPPHRKPAYDALRAALPAPPAPPAPPRPTYPLWTTKPKPSSKLSAILECPVCYDRFVTPITVCENGHCICSNCKYQLKTCPLCRAQFSTIRMTIIDQIMDITDFHCKNADAGCKVRLPYKDIWNHELDCEFRTVSCDIVAFHNPPELLCNEDVVVAHFHEHIEKCHQASVAPFALNTEWRGQLRRHKANDLRLLKNAAGTLHFIERIYVSDEEVFFSYHYVGRSEDASNYVYTVDIHGGAVPRKLTYSNFCLPNYMGVFDTEVDERCLILEPDKIFDPHQTKFDYSVRIEDANVHRMRLKKSKFMLSN